MVRRYVTTERFVLVVAALVVVGGVVGTVWAATHATTADRPRIETNAFARFAAIDGLSATRTTTVERNGTLTSQTVYSVQVRPGTGKRRLSLVDGPHRRYDRRVSNGSVLWLYDRQDGVVTEIPLSGVSERTRRGQRIQALFARLDASDRPGTAAPNGSLTVEPLPVVPQSRAGGPAVAAAEFAVRYAGTATVDDRTAHVLRVAPRNGTANASYEQTLWIDTERFFPIKQRTAWTDGGERTVLTTTYTDVRFDPGLEADRFTMEVPPNATVQRPETPETQTYRRIDDLRAATGVSVPDPDLPPSYTLTYATRTEGRVHGVGLRYANGTSLITVAKYNFTYASDGGGRVRIDGQPASLSGGSTVSVSWSCDTYRYTVRGRGVSVDGVVDVGRSVGCPGAGR